MKDRCQFQGGLVGNGMVPPIPSDISRFSNLFCELAETSITYPCRLKIEAYVLAATVGGGQTWADRGIQLAVISAGIASRGLDE